MDSSRKQRWKQLQSAFEPGFRRMLVVSLLLHLLLPILYHISWFPKKEPVKPPVYRVNLVNKPVRNPQAGRPEAVATKPKPAPKPKPKAKPKPVPVKPKPVSVKPKPEPKPKPKPKVKPAPKPAPKPEPAKVSKVQENALQKRLEQLRAKQQQQQAEAERKARLDALRAAVAKETEQVESPVLDAPVGMPTGKGDEAGVEATAFVQEFIQQQWSLSKYQVIGGNPEAEALLLYSADGRLLHYRFIKKSGNSIFDESLVKAISKSKQLPQNLPEEMEFQIVFNLKDMLDRQ